MPNNKKERRTEAKPGGQEDAADRSFHATAIDPQSMSKVVDALEGDHFFPALFAAINAAVEINNCSVILFSPDKPPLMLTEWSKHYPNHFRMLYCRVAYALDPFYLASLERKFVGFSFVKDVAPDDFDRSEYYRTFYGRIDLVDEIGLLLPLDEAHTLHVSVGRDGKSRRFSVNDLMQLQYFEPLLRALLIRHAKANMERWRLNAPLVQESASVSGSQMIDRWLMRYKVTEREAEIARFILRGHSNTSIGLGLNISSETVKVHRRNLYAKLRISSQAELFLFFINNFLEAAAPVD